MGDHSLLRDSPRQHVVSESSWQKPSGLVENGGRIAVGKKRRRSFSSVGPGGNVRCLLIRKRARFSQGKGRLGENEEICRQGVNGWPPSWAALPAGTA